ncbi:MAG: choice-of-anchor tandem repeat GloVer-containing protein [Limisphaerales bacterium]
MSALIAGLGLMVASRVEAQTYTTLYSFDGINETGPEAGLILSGNILYGTTALGDNWDNGTVFAFSTNGNGLVPLHSFTEVSDYDEGGTNCDGANPYAGLILSGNTLYGTTCEGGSSADGTVFKVNTDGTCFTNLQSFPTNANPFLFTAGSQAGLAIAGNTLYGTTTYGGSWGYGTVFAVATNGTGFTNLHNFTGDSSEGGDPQAGLILSGNTLYGTTEDGGSWSAGTVFSVKTNGTGFTNLYIFTGGSDGADPEAGVTLLGNTLYGTTKNGGLGPISGTIFAVNIDGSCFRTLHTFTGFPSDGSTPVAGLVLSGNTLYGTTYFGGSSDTGTIFSLSLPVQPQLAITRSGANVVLTWTNTATGFTLQSSTNLSAAAWSTNLPAPVVLNGQYTVTNPISGTQRFYQLSQ